MNQRNFKLAMFGLIFALGVANIVVTLTSGGGLTSVGVLIGGILCVMAAARIWISLKGFG